MKLLIEMPQLFVLFLLSLQASLAATAPFINSNSSSLPIIDLGISVIQATLNASGEHPYLNFSNIRYAQPPIDELRFAAPLAPTGRNATINDGQQGVVCPQANPAWEEFSEEWLSGTPISSLSLSPATLANIPAQDPRTSEDCLFLDVIVPESIFARRQNSSAPVLVWLYGGGYVSGDKSSSGNPAGLLERSFDDNQNGVVFVGLNYRLGLFGWLSGSNDVTSNAGLLDQQLAFKWIQDNIHRFGGDPRHVTVIGESAGAGSIMHHITAYGGAKNAPFQHAILQSPAFQPTLPVQEEEIFESVLETASQISNTSIRTVEDLRGLSYRTLQAVNSIIVGNSQYGTFTFGPVVDGSYVPALPGVSLQKGDFEASVKVMVGHNSDEGLLFTSPFIQNQTTYVQSIEELFPTASTAVITYITETLYPPDFSGTYGYTSQIERTALTISDITIACNTQYMNLAFQNKTYAYIFSVPSGLHGEDVAYTFFNGDTTTPDEGYPVNGTLANIFQDYLVNFAISGSPNRGNMPDFPMYSNDSTVRLLENSNLSLYSSAPPNSRCDYWQEALYV